MKINILGTEYRVETRKVSEDPSLKDNKWSGYCNRMLKLIVIADLSEKSWFNLNNLEIKEYRKKILRHEIIHAFLNESGLWNNAHLTSDGWADDEEMVDWFAIQMPKIFKAFKKVGCL